MAFEYLFDSDALASFNFLLGALFMLLAHMHDRCSLRAIELFTVHALEVFLDLVGRPPILSRAAPHLLSPIDRVTLTGRVTPSLLIADCRRLFRSIMRHYHPLRRRTVVVIGSSCSSISNSHCHVLILRSSCF